LIIGQISPLHQVQGSAITHCSMVDNSMNNHPFWLNTIPSINKSQHFCILVTKSATLSQYICS
jgi:hypothetical protein